MGLIQNMKALFQTWKNIILKKDIVVTLALGSRPRQRLARLRAKGEA